MIGREKEDPRTRKGGNPQGLTPPFLSQGDLLSHFNRPDGARARSIAVVGSSGTLVGPAPRSTHHAARCPSTLATLSPTRLINTQLHSGFGAAIDAADIVVRMNDAHTAGYEHDVGIDRHHIRVGWGVSLEGAAKKGRCDVLPPSPLPPRHATAAVVA